MRAALLLLLAACSSEAALSLPDAGACPETASCEGVASACLTRASSTQHEDVRVGENGIADLDADVVRGEVWYHSKLISTDCGFRFASVAT